MRSIAGVLISNRRLISVRLARFAAGSAGAFLNQAGSRYSSRPSLSALAPEAALAVAAEAAGGVEQVGAVDPHHAGLDLRRHIEREVDALAPDAGRQSVNGVVRQLDRFARRAEGHRASTGPKISCCATIDVGCTLVNSVGG